MENAKLFYAFGYVQINIADLAKGAFAGLATSAAFFFFFLAWSLRIRRQSFETAFYNTQLDAGSTSETLHIHA